MDKLVGRGAVVVGGGSGIGRGIALALGDEGMHVLVADIDESNASSVREEIVRRGGTAHAGQVDGTDRDSLTKLADVATSALGRVHVLVHMVGVHADTSVTDSTEAVWAWFTEFHIMSAVRVVDTFLPLLRAHDDGAHIVVTSSMAGLVALPAHKTGGTNTGVYTVMKHGVLAYGDMLRHEVAPDGIEVSVLCPGAAATNLATTSARHRPERFGGPMPEPQSSVNAMPRERAVALGIMQPEDLGPIVVKGIRANRSYIITHPEMVDQLRARQQAQLDDFAFFAGR
jgi:NAD(P)-dependent dehydrogenase (short-subunit alcohol dehydrogenase family)